LTTHGCQVWLSPGGKGGEEELEWLGRELKAEQNQGLFRIRRHDERVAMKMTGHRTRTVFGRYHIVSPADLQEAARKLTGTLPGTSTQKEKEAACATSSFDGVPGAI
jgi:hypothetical protein